MNQRFNIGEKVIALTNPKTELSQPRIKGLEYKVLVIMYCSRCGRQHINVAGRHGMFGDLTICDCGNEFNDNGLWFTNSNFFVRATEINAAIEELLKVEDYETAAILRDFNLKT